MTLSLANPPPLPPPPAAPEELAARLRMAQVGLDLAREALLSLLPAGDVGRHRVARAFDEAAHQLGVGETAATSRAAELAREKAEGAG